MTRDHRSSFQQVRDHAGTTGVCITSQRNAVPEHFHVVSDVFLDVWVVTFYINSIDFV